MNNTSSNLTLIVDGKKKSYKSALAAGRAGDKAATSGAKLVQIINSRGVVSQEWKNGVHAWFPYGEK